MVDRVIKKKKYSVKLLLWIVGLGLCGGLFGYQILFMDKRPTVYAKSDDLKIATVRRGNFQEFVNVTGYMAPGDTLYLDALEGGQVKVLHVEAGDTVKKGDILLVLENTDLEMDELLKKARILEKEYELESARISCEKRRHALREEMVDLELKLKNFEKDYHRNVALHASRHISTEVFEEIEDNYNYWKEKRKLLEVTREIEERLMAKNVQQTMAGLNLLKTEYLKIQKRLKDLTLASPATGLLTSLDASLGEHKNKGERIAQIDLTDVVKITADIDEYYLGRVMVGNTGEFAIFDSATNTETTYSIILTTISPEVVDNVFETEFAFTGERPENPRLGQSFTIRLALGSAYEAVILKKGPFINNTGGAWVYVVDDSAGTARKRGITIGKSNPDFFEISAGLTPGEKVIITSYDDYDGTDRITLN